MPESTNLWASSSDEVFSVLDRTTYGMGVFDASWNASHSSMMDAYLDWLGLSMAPILDELHDSIVEHAV